jgi:hypothetical protein
MVLSLPILFALAGVLLFFQRIDGMRISHMVVAALLGAQVSTTALATGINAAVSTAGHLLAAVFS